MDGAAHRDGRPGATRTPTITHAAAAPNHTSRARGRVYDPTGTAKQELMRRLRRTKIVATLGPASSERAVIGALFRAGADVFRINMSHTSHERLRELVTNIRAPEVEHERPIGILVDLQGPKLRVGTFAAGPVVLAQGETFILDAAPKPGDRTRVHLPHPEIFASVEPGHTLLLDDGKVRLTATAVDSSR